MNASIAADNYCFRLAYFTAAENEAIVTETFSYLAYAIIPRSYTDPYLSKKDRFFYSVLLPVALESLAGEGDPSVLDKWDQVLSQQSESFIHRFHARLEEDRELRKTNFNLATPALIASLQFNMPIHSWAKGDIAFEATLLHVIVPEVISRLKLKR